MKWQTLILFAVFFTGCKSPHQIVIQDRVVTRDSVIVLLRDTTVYVEIERVVNSDVVRITDTVYLENRYSTSIAYVIDSMLFMQLVQKNQDLPFHIQYMDKERYSDRDSVTVMTDIVEVNRLTGTQTFFVTCGQITLVCLLIWIVLSLFSKKKT